jgi:hypothetical protein
VIHNQQIGFTVLDQVVNFINFALTHVPARMGLVANGSDGIGHNHSRRTSKFCAFGSAINHATRSGGMAKSNLQDESLAAGIRTIKKQNRSSTGRPAGTMPVG